MHICVHKGLKSMSLKQMKMYIFCVTNYGKRFILIHTVFMRFMFSTVRQVLNVKSANAAHRFVKYKTLCRICDVCVICVMSLTWL